MKSFLLVAALLMFGLGLVWNDAEAQTTKCRWNGYEWVCTTTQCTPGFHCLDPDALPGHICFTKELFDGTIRTYCPWHR